MTRFLLFAALLLLAVLLFWRPWSEAPSPASEDGSAAAATATAAPIPFSLSLEPIAIDGMPALHSCVAVEHEGSVVLLAGRTNGMHEFPTDLTTQSNPAFPPQSANASVWVVDLAGQRVLGSKSVARLPNGIRRQFLATNTQYVADDGWLFVVGGYGPTEDGASLETIPQVLLVDLDALVATVTSPNGALDAAFASRAIAARTELAAQVTGGELRAISGSEDVYALAFGHSFAGQYTVGGSFAAQEYTNSVRVLELTAASGSPGPALGVKMLGQLPPNPAFQPPDGPYHRRDLTVEDAVGPGGAPRIVAYGGVFKGGRFEGYLTSMTLAPGTGPGGLDLTEDTGVQQLLSQYDCASIPIHSDASQVQYTVFFGGISQFWWDATQRTLVRDALDLAQGIDGMPFVNSVSVLRVVESGGTRAGAQFVLDGFPFPPANGRPTAPGGGTPASYLGAETVFLPASELPIYPNGVLRLDALIARTTVGYLIGGIASTTPYSAQGQTFASAMVYAVTLDPTEPAAATRLVPPPPAAGSTAR